MRTITTIVAIALGATMQAKAQDNIPSAFECDGIQNNPNKFLFKETERPVKGALLILDKETGSAKFESWYVGNYYVDETSIGGSTKKSPQGGSEKPEKYVGGFFISRITGKGWAEVKTGKIDWFWEVTCKPKSKVF